MIEKGDMVYWRGKKAYVKDVFLTANKAEIIFSKVKRGIVDMDNIKPIYRNGGKVTA